MTPFDMDVRDADYRKPGIERMTPAKSKQDLDAELVALAALAPQDGFAQDGPETRDTAAALAPQCGSAWASLETQCAAASDTESK